VTASKLCARCPEVIPSGTLCPACQAAARAKRGSAATQGYGRRHRETFRAAVLARDPVCKLCLKAWATEADHWPLSRRELVAAGLDPDDPQHGRGLCKPCHSRETARHQPGGWNDRWRAV